MLGGRPRKEIERKKTISLQSYYTPQQHEVILKVVELKAMAISQFINDAVYQAALRYLREQ